ncbi:MAG: hypothetical protein EAZ43_07805 [Betaproteobacteria bacterium]|nr:MAG: hypothetical protein EAZ43_07805 [Betaproteobacteria bacterium]
MSTAQPRRLALGCCFLYKGLQRLFLSCAHSYPLKLQKLTLIARKIISVSYRASYAQLFRQISAIAAAQRVGETAVASVLRQNSRHRAHCVHPTPPRLVAESPLFYVYQV